MKRNKLTYVWLNRWTVFAVLLLLIVATPALTIVVQLFSPEGPQWQYVSGRLASHYIPSTIVLLIGVSILSLLIGVSTAWFVSVYEFPGRKLFEWLLILPLAFPAYMMAYSYVGLLEYTGPVHAFLRNRLGMEIQGPIVDIMNIWGAIFVLSMSLYPYLYVICRASFVMRSRDLQDAALSLGKPPSAVFWKIALPMARPAIFAGLALIAMEVLNDYGTVKYFGVDTFTTGIFRAWFSMGDISTGIRLSAILILFVIGVLWMERKQRGRRLFTSKSSSLRKPLRQPLRGGYRVGALVICVLVLQLAFLLPFGQIIYWVHLTAHKVIDSSFWLLAGNSFLLAAGSALLITVLATILLYAARISRVQWVHYLSELSVLGYAIPGAVIAIGIYLPVVAVDQWLVRLISGQDGLYLSLTVFMLVFAYTVRFMAVAYNAASAGYQKAGTHISEAARTLGASPWRTLRKVDLPLIKGSLGASLLLVFVDIIKELPLTLILRPFNFHTLATKAFDLATNEQIAESANSSLFVLLTGILPILLLNKLVKEGLHG